MTGNASPDAVDVVATTEGVASMTDEMDRDPDTLTRGELAELPGPIYDVARVLDDWLQYAHGIASSHHNAGLFLDLLAAEGYRVEPIEVPSLTELLPAPTE